jgi:DNA polymerase delta subunit 1
MMSRELLEPKSQATPMSRSLVEQKFQLLQYYVCQGQVPVSNGQSRHDMLTETQWKEHPETSVSFFGRSPEGRSVTGKVVMRPCLVVRLEREADAKIVHGIARDISNSYRAVPPRLMHLTDQFYRDAESPVPAAKKFPIMFLHFNSMKTLYMTRAKLMQRNPEFVEGDVTMREKNIPKYLDVPFKVTHSGSSAMVQVVEKSIPLQLQLMSETGIRPSSWVRAVGWEIFGLSRDDVQLEVILERADHAFEPVEDDTIAPLLIYSFDIEVTSREGFPVADTPDHAVIAIASSMLNTATGVITQDVHGLCHFTHHPGVDCYSYDSEMTLFEGWARSVIAKNPDIITGYNIDQFDWEYIMTRAKRCVAPDSVFYFMGKLQCVAAEFTSMTSSTKAFGKKDTFYFKLPGRINFDLLPFLRRNMATEEEYGLGAISTKLLGHTKDDLSIPQMNEYYWSGDPDKQWLVMKYCVQDTRLPLEIIQKKLTVVLEVEMSRVCSVFLDDLWRRGQIFRVTSQLFLYARERGCVVSNINLDEQDVELGFTGAKVLDAHVGPHEGALTVDFASLYPTIIIANNLCSSSMVPAGPPAEPDGLTYKTVQIDAQRSYTFQQDVPGLLPGLLRKLLEARAVAKKDMKRAATVELRNIMEGRQLALKVSANSIYGTQGAANSSMGCKPVAECTTCLGRRGLERCVQEIEHGAVPGLEGTGARVIYGDTDSLFVVTSIARGRPWDEYKGEVFAIGREIVRALNLLFEKPISIELEKAWKTLVLMGKKSYIGVKCMTEEDEGHMDAKGYAIVKRDYCAWQRETMQVVIETFLVHNDLAGSLAQLMKQLDKLMSINPRELMLTKKLGSDYKSENLLQCVVARKANEREPGFGPKPGDRVQYLVLAGPPPMYNKVDDFKYAVREKLPIDFDDYADRLINPLKSFFECFGSEVMARVLSIFRDAAGKRYRIINRVMDLCEFVSSQMPSPGTPRVMPMASEAKPKRKQGTVFGEEVVVGPKKKKPRRPKPKAGKQASLDLFT